MLLVQAAAARPVGMRLSPLAGRPRHDAGDSSRGHSQRACNVPPSCLRPVTCSSGTFLPKALDSIVSRIEARVSAATHLPVSHAENLQILRWVGEGGWGPEGCCLLRWVGGRAREGCCLLRGRCTSAPLAAGCAAAMPPLVVWLGALQGLTHSPAAQELTRFPSADSVVFAAHSFQRYELGQEYRAHWDTIGALTVLFVCLC